MGLRPSRPRCLEVENQDSYVITVTSLCPDPESCVKASQEVIKSAPLPLVPPEIYWSSRVKELVSNQTETDKVLRTETGKARAEVDYRFRKYVGEKGGGPCSNASQSLIRCLSDSGERPLNCSQQMRVFSDCIDTQRVLKLSTEDECSRKPI